MTVTLDGKTLNVKDISLHYNFVGVERDIWNSTKGLCRRIKTLGVVREWTLECFEENVPWTDSVARYLEEQAAAGAELDFNVNLGDLYTVNTRVQVLGCDLTFDAAGDVNVRRFTVKVRDKGYNPSGITDDSYVLYLPMDEGGGGAVYDRSGYDNHGTVYGATWVDGRYGKALQFDGVDDYVKLNSLGPGDAPDEFTVAMWIYSEMPVGDPANTFLLRPQGTTANRWEISFHDGHRVTLYLYNGSAGAKLSLSNAITQNEWCFLTFVFKKDTKMEIWINGVKKKDKTPDFSGGIGTSDRYFRIGYRGWWRTDNKFFDGIIDELRVYNRALSEDEIEWLYRSGLIRLGVKYLQPISIEQTLIQKASDIPTWENGAFTLQRELQGQIREWTIECIEEDVPWTRSSALYAAERTLLEGAVPFAVRSEVLALEETNVKLRNLEIHLEPLGNKNVRKYTLTLQET